MRPFRLPARIGVFGEAQITLQQALAMALANNKDITASRIDREITAYNLTGARGLYDPTVGAVSQFLKQVNPVASSLGGSATGAVLNRTWQTDPTLSGSTPWLGGSYHIDFSSQRVYTNNSFATLNPQYPTALVFQYTQPLLRNLRYDQNRHTIDVAKKNRSLSDEQFRQRVMQVVQQTEQAYWELFYAYNNLQVQLDSVDIARMQDESNRRQQEQGLLAPIDVVAAQTQLANFELNAYSAQTTLTQAENNLKTLMLEGRSSALWASALIPVTPPETAAPVTPLTDAVNQALADRPEVAEVQINGEINQRDTRYFREQIKPQVDVIASYTRNGLAGPQILQSGPNPITASFGPLIDRLNVLSATAGLTPINLNGGGSTTPRTPHRRLRPVARQPVGRQFPHHANSTQSLAAHPQPRRRSQPQHRHRPDPPHSEPARTDRAGDRSRRAQHDAVDAIRRTPPGSRPRPTRIRRRTIQQRAAPVPRRHLDTLLSAAAPDHHDQRPQPGTPRPIRPRRSHLRLRASHRLHPAPAQYQPAIIEGCLQPAARLIASSTRAAAS